MNKIIIEATEITPALLRNIADNIANGEREGDLENDGSWSIIYDDETAESHETSTPVNITEAHAAIIKNIENEKYCFSRIAREKEISVFMAETESHKMIKDDLETYYQMKGNPIADKVWDIAYSNAETIDNPRDIHNLYHHLVSMIYV